MVLIYHSLPSKAFLMHYSDSTLPNAMLESMPLRRSPIHFCLPGLVKLGHKRTVIFAFIRIVSDMSDKSWSVLTFEMSLGFLFDCPQLKTILFYLLCSLPAGSTRELQYALMSFGIPESLLPITFSGSLR